MNSTESSTTERTGTAEDVRAEGYGSFERVIVCAAGHGHVFGPDPSAWPVFALREVEGWLKPAIARAVVAPPEDGRPTYAELVAALRPFAVERYWNADRQPSMMDFANARALLSRIPKEEP